MSREGIAVAKEYGTGLPVFASASEAEKTLLAQRDATLEALDLEIQSLRPDYSPDSLKGLEKWYVEKGSPEVGLGGYSLPLAIGFYFGEVLCRRAGFEWFVAEFAFERGRYEIGVRKPLVSIMLTKGKRPRIEGNKRMQSLWREYGNYAA
ncbi:MAG TPA: hypothetical protein VKF40_29095 [Burkholderiales bacterium]|nr:hypothetical protein [Burkholderiales bacterium]